MEKYYGLELRTFYDIVDEKNVSFYTDASQKLVTGLEFNAQWCIVKQILIDWGYQVVELPNPN